MEIVQITYLGSGQTYQDYENRDDSLISSNFITPNFGDSKDYVEFFVYDESNNIIGSNYNLISYRPEIVDPKTNLFTAIAIDPKKDLESLFINRGTVNVQYNFLRNLFNSSLTSQYFIKEISPSRTELKLASLDISNTDIQLGFSSFQTATSTKNYYSDFYLNFGSNVLLLATNVAYTEDNTDSYILIKLYEPLPFEFDVKSTLWMVEKAAESVSYEVDIQVPPVEEVQEFALRGANFNIKVNNSLGQTTPYYNYTSLFSSELSSSAQQLKSWYEDKAIQINVDYTNFENFVHFSSATERINNFVYKLKLIESYNDQIINLRTYVGGSGTLSVTSASIATIQKNIDRIVEKFDTYEYYLYFSSESLSWPKYNSTKPYIQVSITSSQASNWLGSEYTKPTGVSASILFSASYYDAQNQNRLTNTIPTYLVDDSSNQPYLTFLDMVGQHFDNVWIYYKDVSNRYNAANNPQKGISIDQVADALRGMGMEIYTNSTISDSVYFSLFGVNPDGSLLPPTGSEMIKQIVTSSLPTLASNDIEKEIYKRIYHNLPYLLKSRGTERGIKALLACYGIPENVLTIKEFGGYNRYSKVGVLESNSDKITYVSSSLPISSSLLNPYSTLQYYSNDDYVNSTNVEVAFSPADVFDAHITSSLPNLRIENIIGSPGYLLSSSYDELDRTYEKYLRDNYVKRYNLWDYVRLVKYYNNSIFKMIKDFVPARSNVSTGIVIKDHILHRNKYQRHDPDFSLSSNYSQSIDTAFISAEHANSLSGSSTQKVGFYTSSIGYVPYTSSQGIEKYTGELMGSEITITTLGSFNPQFEFSMGSNANLGVVTQSLLALYQNVSQSLRSRRFIDLDYDYQQNVPVNFDLIKYVINQANSNNPNWESLYTDSNVPFAYLQDYNYATNAFTVPRYFGSKVQSSKFTFYVEGESGSLGKTAAVDKIKYQYAYLVDIYTASFNLPGRSNAQIKYIIDNNQKVLDLTKANTNVFYTQNIFKSGETTNVSLFDYDPRNQDVQYLTNKKDLEIFEGGWRYSPILYHFKDGPCASYKIDPPEITVTTSTSDSTIANEPSTYYTVDDFAITATPTVIPYGGWIYTTFKAQLLKTTAAIENTYINITLPRPAGNTSIITLFLPAGNYYTDNKSQPNPNDGTKVTDWQLPFIYVNYVYKTVSIAGGTVTTTMYKDSIDDCDPGLYTIDDTNIMLSLKQSQYYGRFIMNPGVDYPNMEIPAFNFEMQTGDMIKFKDPDAGWIEKEEYRIVNVYGTVDTLNNSRIAITLDKPLNVNVTDDKKIPSTIKNYVISKHVPDETNVILRYNPKTQITQDGILYPEYIDPKVKDQSGDTIKSLKSQNLI